MTKKRGLSILSYGCTIADFITANFSSKYLAISGTTISIQWQFVLFVLIIFAFLGAAMLADIERGE